MNTPTLKTERLTLRKFTEQDIEALFSILREEEVNRFLPWYPLKDLEETRRFYEERYVLNYARPQGYAYAICLKKITFQLAISILIWKKHMIWGMDCVRNFGIEGLLPKRQKL